MGNWLNALFPDIVRERVGPQRIATWEMDREDNGTAG